MKLIAKLKAKYKKLRGLDKYIIYCLSIMLIYAVAEMIVSSVTGTSHDTLTTVFYGVHGSELLMCAFIKRYKIKKEMDDG